MTWALLIGSILALLFAFWLRRSALRQKVSLNLPGEIVYSDDSSNDQTFISDKYGLSGKPDYILKADGELIPVERKSRELSRRGPYDGEILQLAAYCLLVEEHFSVQVRRGQLMYPNRTIDIIFDAELRSTLLATLRDIELAGDADVSRDHRSPGRCRGCGFRHSCRDSLV